MLRVDVTLDKLIEIRVTSYLGHGGGGFWVFQKNLKKGAGQASEFEFK